MAIQKPENLDFECPKCGNRSCEVDEMRATGGFLSKLFDVQRNRFTTVTCTRCKYTELYRVESGLLGEVFDFLTQ